MDLLRSTLKKGITTKSNCGYRIMAIITAFQAEDVSSTLTTRSNLTKGNIISDCIY